MTLGRRRFLQWSAAVAGPFVARTALGGPQIGASDSTDPVVVVGAGLAGLHAASFIREAGRRVVVLEARGAPGGRVQTIRAPFEAGQHAEAGPIRIAASHTTVLQLVQAHGLELVPFESSNGAALVTIGKLSVRADALKESRLPLRLRPDEQGLSQGALLERYVGPLAPELAELTPSAVRWARWAPYDRVAWPEWLRARGASDGAVTLMTLGGDSSELSALYVLRQYAMLGGTTQFYKIRGGMDQLPRAMAAALGDVVRYDAAVVAIEQTADAVRVDYAEAGRRQSLRASRVIFAIPFSTLGRIDISPAFSSFRRAAINELPYFPATRVLLQARTRFWHGLGLSGRARTDAPAEMWDCTYDQEGTPGILGATMRDPAGAETSPDAALRAGRTVVARAFPGIQSAFTRGVAHSWAREPWSRGAFAVFHPGQMAAMMPDIARPEGRVHFAGEHTAGWMGWMEGALESGERAAREVLT